MEVFARHNGVWKPAETFARSGGVWARAEHSVRVAGVYQAEIAAAPLSVSAAPLDIPIVVNASNPELDSYQSAISTSVTVSGGSGNFTYQWNRVSGDSRINASSTTSATTKMVFAGQAQVGIAAFLNCTVTDTDTNETATTNNVRVETE